MTAIDIIWLTLASLGYICVAVGMFIECDDIFPEDLNFLFSAIWPLTALTWLIWNVGKLISVVIRGIRSI